MEGVWRLSALGRIAGSILAIYAFGMIKGGNALGFSGLAANCISVGQGIIESTQGLFYLTKNVLSLNTQETSFASKKSHCIAIAQNIHRVIVGLAMINTVFAPTPVANVIVGVELLRSGLVKAIEGSTQMQKSLKFTDDGKCRDWAGVGEALVTVIFG
ncbi:MAG TPA: hypothetical protein VGP47_06235 [Parachlamydiaceae bacterium]|nr:hypothetical protein [Parachlamydiaceae bacterium]